MNARNGFKRLYKSGKLWVAAGVTAATFSATVMLNQQSVNADAETTPTELATSATTTDAASDAAAAGTESVTSAAETQAAETPATAQETGTPATTVKTPASGVEATSDPAPETVAPETPAPVTTTQENDPAPETPAPALDSENTPKPAVKTSTSDAEEEEAPAPAEDTSSGAVQDETPVLAQKASTTGTGDEAAPAVTKAAEATPEAAAAKVGSQKLAVRAATKKNYIYYNEVDSESDNQYGVTFVKKTDNEGNDKYFTYNQEEDKLDEVTDKDLLAEIAGAYEAGKVTTHYFEDKAELETAINGGKDQVKGHEIITTPTLPDDIGSGAVVITYAMEYVSPTDQNRPENATERYFVKDGEDYYWYGGAEQPRGAQLTADEVSKIIDGQKYQVSYAPQAVLEEYLRNPENTQIDRYIIHEGDTLPDDITNSSEHYVAVYTYKTEYKNPDGVEPGDGFTINTIYFKDGSYYEFKNGEFVKLSTENQTLLSGLETAGKIKVSQLKNEDGNQEKLVEANDAGAKFVTIDGQVYMLKVTHDVGKTDGLAIDTDFEPNAMKETELHTGDPLTPLVTVNPGVSISLFDYWIKDQGGPEWVSGNNATQAAFANQGINLNHALKFSTGSAGNLNLPDNGKWNNYISTPNYQIVEMTLDENGYPVMRNSGQSLDYLFDGTAVDGKQVVFSNQEQKIFISDGNGMYTFDSAAHHADYDSDNGTFVIYNMPNNYNAGGVTPGAGQFMPLNNVDQFFEGGQPKKFNPAWNAGMNHYFGMTMETDYVQPTGGQVTQGETKTDMVFNFSGDDDFWLYIDGKLALDIGGIHDVASGQINFATGAITYKDKDGKVLTPPKGVPTDMDDVVAGWDAENSSHKMKVFYLERGNHLSNLQVQFNLQIPNYTYAEKSDYASNDKVVDETTYVWGETHETMEYQVPEEYAYAAQEAYGVSLETTDPETPSPETPEPETPEPETPEPETPEPETPEPETPEPETPTPGEPEDELVVTPETPSTPEASKPAATEQVAMATPEKTTVTLKADGTKQAALPQTGEKKEASLGAFGIALVMSLLGLVGFRKKSRG